MGSKAPTCPPKGSKPPPPPAPPPRKHICNYGDTIESCRCDCRKEVSQGVDIEFIHAGLLQTYANLNKKHEELCEAVDNLLGHCCYFIDDSRSICCNRCIFCGDNKSHKEDCPWKKLQDLMNE